MKEYTEEELKKFEENLKKIIEIKRFFIDQNISNTSHNFANIILNLQVRLENIKENMKPKLNPKFINIDKEIEKCEIKNYINSDFLSKLKDKWLIATLYLTGVISFKDLDESSEFSYDEDAILKIFKENIDYTNPDNLEYEIKPLFEPASSIPRIIVMKEINTSEINLKNIQATLKEIFDNVILRDIKEYCEYINEGK